MSRRVSPSTYSAWLREVRPSGLKFGAPPSWTMRLASSSAWPCSSVACCRNSAATRSEIVVPVVRDGRVVAVLDLDSEAPAHFDAVDAEQLGQVAALAATLAW
jgi:hypothetical protein